MIFFKHSIYVGLSLAIAAPSTKSQELDTYTINYLATAGVATASARRSLSKIEGNTYQLLNTINVELAGQSVTKIIEISEIILSKDKKWVPNSYSKEQLGFKETFEKVIYDWDQSIAKVRTTDRSSQVNLEKGTFDQLSHQIAIRENFTEGNERLSYNIIDKSTVEEYQYTIVGEEDLRTALGDFRSIKIERTQPEDDSRSIVFWLSTDWAGVLLKMNQVIGMGIEVSLEIQDGVVNGKPITGKRKF